LPIIAKDVEGKRVSIYNERTHPKFPLLGLQMKKHVGRASDARTDHGLRKDRSTVVTPKDRRSPTQRGAPHPYAVDLGTEVDSQAQFRQRALSRVSRQSRESSTPPPRCAESKTLHHRQQKTTRSASCWWNIPSATSFKLVESAKPTETGCRRLSLPG